MAALAAVFVLLASVPIGVAGAFAYDFVAGDRRVWLELTYGSRRRAVMDLLLGAAEAAPLMILMAAAILAAARFCEHAKPSAKPLAALVLGAMAGGLVGASVPLFSLLGVTILVVDAAARGVLLRGRR